MRKLGNWHWIPGQSANQLCCAGCLFVFTDCAESKGSVLGVLSCFCFWLKVVLLNVKHTLCATYALSPLAA